MKKPVTLNSDTGFLNPLDYIKIDLYFINGCNMKKNVRKLDYGSSTGILRWVRERYPDKASKPVPREWTVDYRGADNGSTLFTQNVKKH